MSGSAKAGGNADDWLETAVLPEETLEFGVSCVWLRSALEEEAANAKTAEGEEESVRLGEQVTGAEGSARERSCTA